MLENLGKTVVFTGSQIPFCEVRMMHHGINKTRDNLSDGSWLSCALTMMSRCTMMPDGISSSACFSLEIKTSRKFAFFSMIGCYEEIEVRRLIGR